MNLNYFKKSVLVFSIICIPLILLSLIGLIWNNYYIATSMSIGFFCALINLILLHKSTEMLKPDSEKKSAMALIVMFNFIRTILAIASIALSALVVYLTIDGGNIFLYLSIIGASVPFLMIAIVSIFIREDD